MNRFGRAHAAARTVNPQHDSFDAVVLPNLAQQTGSFLPVHIAFIPAITIDDLALGIDDRNFAAATVVEFDPLGALALGVAPTSGN